MTGFWISTKERLPEVDRKVRFTASWTPGYFNEYRGSRDGDGMWISDDQPLAFPKEDVIEWLDLPLPEEE